jgi:hypothetical protein
MAAAHIHIDLPPDRVYDLVLPARTGGRPNPPHRIFTIARGPKDHLAGHVGTGVAWQDREADLVRGVEHTLSKLKAEAERR